MRRRAVLAMLAVTLGSLAMAASELTGLSLRGQGRMRYFGLSIYDIRLWSAAPVSAERWADLPLTLEIEYARSLDGG